MSDCHFSKAIISFARGRGKDYVSSIAVFFALPTCVCVVGYRSMVNKFNVLFRRIIRRTTIGFLNFCKIQGSRFSNPLLRCSSRTVLRGILLALSLWSFPRFLATQSHDLFLKKIVFRICSSMEIHMNELSISYLSIHW